MKIWLVNFLQASDYNAFGNLVHLGRTLNQAGIEGLLPVLKNCRARKQCVIHWTSRLLRRPCHTKKNLSGIDNFHVPIIILFIDHTHNMKYELQEQKQKRK